MARTFGNELNHPLPIIFRDELAEKIKLLAKEKCINNANLVRMIVAEYFNKKKE